MQEDTIHILESFGVPECRHRLPVVLSVLEKLDNKGLKAEERNELLDVLLLLFEQQREDAQRLLGSPVQLNIRELIGAVTHNKRLLINRLRVFKMRSE